MTMHIQEGTFRRGGLRPASEMSRPDWKPETSKGKDMKELPVVKIIDKREECGEMEFSIDGIKIPYVVNYVINSGNPGEICNVTFSIHAARVDLLHELHIVASSEGT